MKQENIQEILCELNGKSGYSQRFKETVVKMLPSLRFDYGLRTIDENLTILPAVDRLMDRYKYFNPVACTWHDIGPKPFGGDFMAGYLDDCEDMFIVLLHPYDESNNLGIHVKFSDLFDGEQIGFELNDVSCDEDCYISEEEIICRIDAIVENWN